MRNLTRVRLQRPGCVAACAVLACAAVSSVARDARACPQDPPEIRLFGVPADGDVDVPTDVIPYYAIVDRVETSDALARFTITAEDGTVMLARFRVADQENFELAPDDPLQPNTKYLLHAEFVASRLHPAGSAEVRFTTGAGPLAEAPESPRARLIHYDLDRASDCLPSFGTCVSLGDDRAIVVVTFVDDKETLGTIGHRGSFFSTIDVPPTFLRCAQIHTRAMNGALSAPIMLCGSTVVSMAFHDTDRLECSSAGLKPLPPSPRFMPISSHTGPPDAGKLPTLSGPVAHDAGTHMPDAQVADSTAPDAAVPPMRMRAGSCGCDVAQRSTPPPIAALLFTLLALRRRTKGG